MTSKGPTLETERLILRPPQAEDFDAWAVFMADDQSARFIGGSQARAAAWRGFLTVIGAWQVQGFALFSVIEKSSGAWVGRVGPWMPEGWPGTEVGWGIVRSAEGKGYASEAAAAAINWAFDTLDWHEVIHAIQPENAPSKAVAAKLGSRYLRQGWLPSPYDFELEIWGQSREDWRSTRALAGEAK